MGNMRIMKTKVDHLIYKIYKTNDTGVTGDKISYVINQLIFNIDTYLHVAILRNHASHLYIVLSR